MRHCDDRRDALLCGEGFGGDSHMNGMVRTQGIVADYDAWSSMGRTPWVRLREGIAISRRSGDRSHGTLP